MPRPRKARAVAPKNQHPEPGIRWLEARACWRADVYRNGQSISKTFSSLTDAKNWKRETQVAPPSEQRAVITVAAWITRYLDDLDHEAALDSINGLAPRTRAGYREKLERYAKPHFERIPLASLTSLEVRDWVKTIQEDHTINAAWEAHRRLKGCLTTAVRARLIPHNPCDGWNPPNGGKGSASTMRDKSRWTDAEVQRIMDYLETPSSAVNPIRYLMRVWLATGLRKQEILGLRWQDIDFTAKIIHVAHTVTNVNGKQQMREKTKTGKARAVRFDDYALIALLAQYREVNELRAAQPRAWADNGLVFPSERGKPLHLTVLRKWYERICKAANAQIIRPYDVRATHGSALHFNLGMDDVEAARRMGHSVQIYLNTYVRPLEQTDERTFVDTSALYTRTKPAQNPNQPKDVARTPN